MSNPSFRVIYSGVKHIYSCDTIIDVRFIEYSKNDCIEAVAYNSALAIQYPSLYLRFSAIKNKISEDDLNSVVANRVNEFKRTKSPIHLGVLKEIMRERMQCQYILSLLELDGDVAQPSCSLVVCRRHSIHTQLGGAAEIWARKPAIGDLYYIPPSQLHVQTLIPTKEEEDYLIGEQMKTEICKQCLEVLLKQKKPISAHFSLPRRRWLLAIRKVLLHLRVLHARSKLLELFGPNAVLYLGNPKVSKQESMKKGRLSGISPHSGSNGKTHQRRLSLESYQLLQNKAPSNYHMLRQHSVLPATAASHGVHVDHLLPPLESSGKNRRLRQMSSDNLSTIDSGKGHRKTLDVLGKVESLKPIIRHQRSFSAGGVGLDEILEKIGPEVAAAPLEAKNAILAGGIAHSGSSSHLSKMISLREMHTPRVTPRVTPQGSPKITPKKLTPIQPAQLSSSRLTTPIEEIVASEVEASSPGLTLDP